MSGPDSSPNGGYEEDIDTIVKTESEGGENGNGYHHMFHHPSPSPVPDNYSSIVTCSHIKSVLESRAKETVFVTYRQAVTISQPLNSDSQTFISNKDGSIVPFEEVLAKQTASLKCSDCKLNNFQTSMICLQCPHVGCFTGENNHAMLHYKATNHLFAIESRSGLLYCFSCGDYTNHQELENIRSEIMGNGSDKVDFNENNYSDPNQVSINGLKGFVNLGATCFMSSILQTLIHNPIIKYQFFNNDVHYFNCQRNRLQYMNGGVIQENNACITCSIDSIFQYFYTNSNIEGFGMTNLLTTSWYKKKSLAGFQEQDAHEFWQFLLNEFHSDLQRIMGRPSLPTLTDNNQCKCITHTTFAFELQSSIKCSLCENITETIDPMIDLSLEINNLHSKKQIDIYDCLDLFTSEEKLDILYSCKSCGEKSKPTKTLRLKSIPPVLSIQLKRFEHRNDSTSKIETPVTIPLFLNLTKYCHGGSDGQDIIDGNKIFELFAVVCHIGSVNTGHYIVYIKDGNGCWFMYDDSVISLVSSQDVTNKNAYLLYYITHKI
ncbi:Ubiquitin carboxyl-terminal hydrolase 8 [Spathaspora sp. JA1]|nr:Ubiquitin carboxyl-terminal hydrolase 8 [Spathaspora sp. JA1]